MAAHLVTRVYTRRRLVSCRHAASTLIPPLLLSCLLVVTGSAEVLQVGAVHEAAAVGEWDDVAAKGDCQTFSGIAGIERRKICRMERMHRARI